MDVPRSMLGVDVGEELLPDGVDFCGVGLRDVWHLNMEDTVAEGRHHQEDLLLTSHPSEARLRDQS